MPGGLCADLHHCDPDPLPPQSILACKLMAAHYQPIVHLLLQVTELVRQCWLQLPVERPTMKAVCTELESIIRAVEGSRSRSKSVARTR